MSVRVAVRFRPPPVPLHNSPQLIKEENLQLYPSLGCVNVAKHFNLYFHHVLPLYSTQDEVFSVVQPLVNQFLQGINTCCITYGPAGCGKTYTMYGPGGEQTSPQTVYRLGLMPRVISYIFDQLEQRFSSTVNGQFAYQLKWSFAEIYNKHIYDLLSHHSQPQPKKKTSNIKFKQKDNGSYYYQNLTKVTISSIADVLRYMYEAFHNRRYVVIYDEFGNRVKQSTDANNWSSSRSHCVSTLRLMFKKRTTNEMFRVSMVFMDCGAYCKMIDNDSNSASDHDFINRCFLALGNTVTGIHRQDPNKELSWIDNILTQALYPVCTDPKAKILLFLNCTANNALYEESLATLRFGNLAMTDPLLLSVMDNYRLKIKQLHIVLQKHSSRGGDGARRRSSSSRRRSSGVKTPKSTKSTKSKSKSNSHKSNRTHSPISDESKDSSGDSVIDIMKNENNKLKHELHEIKKVLNMNNKQMNELRIDKHRINKEKNIALGDLDVLSSQTAASELRRMEIANELQCSMQNEQLLRDENAEQKRQLFVYQSKNQSRREFLVNSSSIIQRASIFQSNTGLYNSNETKIMINELSKQIEEMEISRADLKVQLNQQNKKMKMIAESNSILKKEHSLLQSSIAHLKSNTVSKHESQQEIQSLLNEIHNRDIRISEFERDAQENIGISNHWKEQNEVYEKTIQHLGDELGQCKKLFEEYKLMVNNQSLMNSTSNTDSTATIVQMLSPTNINIDNNQEIKEMKEKFDKMIYHKDEAIRSLRLNLARAKTQSFKDEVLEKLKRRNNTLEERLIQARSEKAKMIPQLVKEKNSLKDKNADMKRNIILYIAMMIFKEKKMKKQLSDAKSDVERYQHKFNQQIKGRGKLRKQMETLDSFAQDINNRVNDNDDIKEDNNNLSTNQHFARVQQTISDLTMKLQSKHDKIMKLEEKLAGYELQKSISSNQWISPPSSSTGITTEMDVKMMDDNTFSNDLISVLTNVGHVHQPNPTNSLSLGFMIDNKRNVRISLDVNASFWDILHLLQVRSPPNLHDLQLKITAHQSPMKNEIIIPHECMHKSFWDLIIEFGIFQFLSMDVITNASEIEADKQLTAQPKPSGGLFRRLKSLGK